MPAVHDLGARLAAVHRYEILDTPRDGTYTEIARAAALVCGTPIAAVTVVDTDRVWFAATHGLPPGLTEIGADSGLCASAVLDSDALYQVSDAALDPRTLDHPLVRGELGLRFYAAAPVLTDDGHRLGTVNVIDLVPRELSPVQGQILQHLAAVVGQNLQLRLEAIHAVTAAQILRAEKDIRDGRDAAMAARISARMQQRPPEARPASCELGGSGRACPEPAELKVADPWGSAAWGCSEHVEEALIHARSVFVADADQAMLDTFRNR